jgi:pimeloyl-ACP methyl ester carboxylesterase
VPDIYRSLADEERVRRWVADRLAGWPERHSTATVRTTLGDTHLTMAGAGPDICVYLPGTNFNAATSTRVLTALAQHQRVVCADLPGQPGLSAGGRPRDETQGYARWAAEVLAEVRRREPHGRVALVGHSRGAAVALTADPASVTALVLLSPAGLAPVRMSLPVLSRSLAWLLRPTPARSARLVTLMAAGQPGGPDEVTEWMTLVARSTRTTGAPGPLPGPMLDRWRGHPVRVLVGAGDVFFPPRRLAHPVRRHLGVELEIVADAGHLLVDQRPDVVAAAVAAALAAAR